jgi:DNA-directed RNA polymerase II subunit RPB11
MNAPERFLTWRWEDDSDALTKKVTYTPDTRLPNAGMFVLAKEDHTIGNLMRV